MANTITLEGKVRTDKPSKTRQEGFIPGVLYGHGFEAVSIAVPYQPFIKVFRNAGQSSVITLDLGDGQSHSVIVRDIQQHPTKNTVTHVDLYQVRMDEEIEARVPLTFEGVASAVKDLGGVLVKNIDELLINALPANLPHDIVVDISVLDNFEKVIHVKDIALPKGVEALHEDDEVVALVQAPRSEQELDSLSTEIKEDVESVEGVKKPEAPAEGEEAEKSEKK